MCLDMTEKQDNNNYRCNLNPVHTRVFGVAEGSPSPVWYTTKCSEGSHTAAQAV